MENNSEIVTCIILAFLGGMAVATFFAWLDAKVPENPDKPKKPTA